MANRGMSAAMLTEIAKSQVKMVHLMKIGLSTPEYFTTGYKNIAWSGDTYNALGHLLSIGSIKESAGLVVSNFDFTLSGVDQSFIATFLSQNITNKTINIYIGFLDSNDAIIADPVEIFGGRIDAYKVTEDTKAGTCFITVTCVNHWADWEKIAGRRTNDEDQQLYFPGDKGLEFSAEIIKDLKWGQND